LTLHPTVSSFRVSEEDTDKTFSRRFNSICQLGVLIKEEINCMWYNQIFLVFKSYITIIFTSELCYYNCYSENKTMWEWQTLK